MLPPISNSMSTLTRLRRSGRSCTSSIPFCAVFLMVEPISSSSAAPSRANLRSFRSAICMERVSNWLSVSKSRYLRCSHTLTALRFRLSPPTRTPSGWSPYAPNGDEPPVPTHLLPPWCRSFCSFSRSSSACMSASSEPYFLSRRRWASVRLLGSSLSSSHSLGISPNFAISSSISSVSIPSK